MKRRREAGKGIVAGLFLLAVIAGGGAWNYQRNVAVENEVYRPFRTHSDEQLTQLHEAYGSQKDQATARYDNAASRRAAARSQAHFDQQVREFERVQQAGQAKKRLQADLADSTTTLKLLEEEQRLRANERDRVKVFLKRLLTI